MKTYANVGFEVEEVNDIRSSLLMSAWTDEQCAEFLKCFEYKIEDAMTVAGWHAMESILDSIDRDPERNIPDSLTLSILYPELSSALSFLRQREGSA